MNEINEALNLFGLKPPIKSKKEIKRKFRQLSMIHHPDKGGDE